MECPYCAKTIKAEAKFCQFCGKEIEQGTENIQPKVKNTVSDANTGNTKSAIKGIVVLIISIALIVIGIILFKFGLSL